MTRARKLEQLGLQLVTVSRRYRRTMDAIFSGHGLSFASTLPLRFLALQDRPYRQKELAAVLDVEGPTLVRVLDALVAQGFVLRSEDPTDRRAKLVSVTREGHAFLGQLEDRIVALRDEIFDGVPAADIDTVLRLLARIDTNMEGLDRED